ncbi:MAG: phosphatase PAP2 family protein [Thermoleophilia bacterium]|nr:phosphatase PAP2 family protein [Thermoleophilia bacterium]
MGYHYGRYEPPPAAPALPRSLRDALVPLPGAADHPALKVPPPPAAAAREAELVISHAAQEARTASGVEWALHMDARGATSMWWGAAQRARRTQGLLGDLRIRAGLVGAQVASLVATHVPGQTKVDLARPFQLDPTMELLGHRPGTSSYPSGHARQAYASARVVARLDPSQAELAYQLADEVAASRVYAGAHLPSDVIAGANLGTAVGDAVLGAARVAKVVVPIAAIGAGITYLAVRDASAA